MKNPKIIINKSAIGKRFKSLRAEKSQADFSEMLNSNPTSISLIEQGKIKPTLEVLTAMSLIYHTTIDFLIHGVDEPAHIEELIEVRTEGYKMAIAAHRCQLKDKLNMVIIIII